MKVTTLLSTAILFLLPATIVYAQEHEQEKQPEQKQQQAKPAQHQEQTKPARQPQQAQHQQQAKPAQQQQDKAVRQPQANPVQQPQQAQHQQQAKPAQQQRGQEQQRANRGDQPAASHRSIPEATFRSNFGSGHRFHVNRSEFANGSGRFQYGGYWFNVVDPWPVGWLYTDDVYVDYLNGGYFLCDPVHPGVDISLNIG
jgi:hypothetical protein